MQGLPMMLVASPCAGILEPQRLLRAKQGLTVEALPLALLSIGELLARSRSERDEMRSSTGKGRECSD